MAVEQRRELGLILFRVPLGKWEVASGDVYKMGLSELEAKERSGVRGSILTRVGIEGSDAVAIESEELLNPWDIDWPPMPMYETRKVSLVKDRINTDLRLGCRPGVKTNLRWRSNNA